MRRKRIVVMGFMAGCPIAGVIWQHLHYIVGLQHLGHEVFYIEDSGRLPYDPTTLEINNDFSYALGFLDRVGREYGFDGRWAFCARYLPDQPCRGLSIERVRELYREADAILNICGTQELNDDLGHSDRLLYIESDPGVEQIRVDKGEPGPVDYLSRHRTLFTFGEHLGTERCPIPTHQFRWLPTRQPIVTDFWKSDGGPPAHARFTSVANWNTSDLKDIEWRGETYLWSKTREFLKFDAAPQVAGETFELATAPRDAVTRERLARLGWHLIDPNPLSVDWDGYRQYLQRSKGEFTVAKDQYVRLNTGWFSDRSACYLAAGRPVITQETGFTDLYGGHGGLFAFRDLDEVAEAVREINADYARHSRAAYEVAAEHFEATKVIASILDRAGL